MKKRIKQGQILRSSQIKCIFHLGEYRIGVLKQVKCPTETDEYLPVTDKYCFRVIKVRE